MQSVRFPPVLLIAGPTASGKSDLAVWMARELNAEIVNIDSVQIYSETEIGSACLSSAEMQGVPHHLVGVRAPDQSISVATFLSQAEKVILEIASRGKAIVLVGGSSLYLTALLYGLADAPPADAALRVALERMSTEDLFKLISANDPERAAKLHTHDRLRVIRALETTQLAGRKASSIIAEHQNRRLRMPLLAFVLCWPREQLYQRIDQRSQTMVERGLLAETSKIIDRYGSKVPVLSTIGFSEATACLQGKLGEQQLAQTIALHTRNLAKRQMTFWRNQPRKLGWEIHPAENEVGIELSNPPPATRRKIPQAKSFRVATLTKIEMLKMAQSFLGGKHEPGTSEIPQAQAWYVAAA